MSDYAKAAAQVKSSSSPVPETDPGLCCVAGCKLPGSLSHSTLGGDWFCRLHFSASYADQPKITAKAVDRNALYRLALRCCNAPPAREIPPELITAIERHGRKDLLETKPKIEGRNLTARALGRHMLQVLDSECARDTQRDFIDSIPTEKDTWTNTENLV